MALKLSILIPTIEGREDSFARLYAELDMQRKLANCEHEVEILYEKDNKEISIGEKRDILYKRAKGLYSVQIDDDDSVVDDYIQTVMDEITKGVDCIGYVERCIMDGQVRYSKISREFPDWETKEENGYHYRRTPFFKTPILTTLCVRTEVNFLRFGEDHDFARRIKPLLNTEIFINKVMYLYHANSLTHEEHLKRYGIK